MFEDTADGSISIKVEFDPPVEKPESGDWADVDVTPAQGAAVVAVQAVQGEGA